MIEQQDIRQKPKINREASISYNPQNNRFDIQNEKELVNFVTDADYETKQKFFQSLNNAQHKISKKYKPGNYVPQPATKSTEPEPDPEFEPIYKYSSVEKENQNFIKIIHQSDPSRNVRVQISGST